MLVYATGVVIIMAAIVTSLVYSYRWYERAVIPSRADEIGSSIASRITNDIRAGETLDIATSAFGIANGRLGLYIKDGSGNSIYRSYSLSDGRVIFKEGATGVPQYLSPADMKVTDLSFFYTTTPNSKDIRYSLSINYLLRTSASGKATSTYSGQATLRNSYE